MNSNKNGVKIGLRIGKLREESGQTQQELADSIGVKRETVNQWENSTRKLKADAIISLAKHFGVSADYILGLSNVRSNDTDMQGACKYTGLSEEAIDRLRKYDIDPMQLSFAIENRDVGGLSDLLWFMTFDKVDKNVLLDHYGNIARLDDNVTASLLRMREEYAQNDNPYFVVSVNLGDTMESQKRHDLIVGADRLRGEWQTMKSEAFDNGWYEGEQDA